MMGVAIGGIVVGAGVIAYLGIRKFDAALPVPPRSEMGLWKMVTQSAVQFIAVFDTKPFAVLTLVKLLQFVVLAIVLASFPYFFLFVLKKTTAELGTYMGLFVVSGIIAIPFIRLFIGIMGKRSAYIVFLALYALSLIHISEPTRPY